MNTLQLIRDRQVKKQMLENARLIMAKHNKAETAKK